MPMYNVRYVIEFVTVQEIENRITETVQKVEAKSKERAIGWMSHFLEEMHGERAQLLEIDAENEEQS